VRLGRRWWRGGSAFGIPGQELAKPGGGTFFVDPNHGGAATRLYLAELFWARLVDVHDVDDAGRARAEPVFRDFAVRQDVQSDGGNYRLETNPITQQTRLVILRKRGAADAGRGTFDSLLRSAPTVRARPAEELRRLGRSLLLRPAQRRPRPALRRRPRRQP
jgi:hypothetical protein